MNYANNAGRRIAVTQMVHLGSHRIPRKVLEEVGGQTLIERGLRTLGYACSIAHCDLLACVPKRDTELLHILDAMGIDRVYVSDADSEADDYQSIVRGFSGELAARYDWAVDFNAVCHPFLRVETVVKIIRQAHIASRPFITAISERGILWEYRKSAFWGIIHGRDVLPDTKTNPLYSRLAHLGWAHPADQWGEAVLARQSEPFILDLAPEERIDIDAPQDLEFARLVSRGFQLAERHIPRNPVTIPALQERQPVEGWDGCLDY